MSLALVAAVFVAFCEAHWPQSGFDSFSTYCHRPFGTENATSPIAFMRSGIQTSNVLASTSPTDPIVSEAFVTFVGLCEEELQQNCTVSAIDLRQRTTVWETVLPQPTDNAMLGPRSYHALSATLIATQYLGEMDDSGDLAIASVQAWVLSAATGLPVWQHTLDGCAQVLAAPPLVLSSGIVVFLCGSNLTAINVTASSGHVLWTAASPAACTPRFLWQGCGLFEGRNGLVYLVHRDYTLPPYFLCNTTTLFGFDAAAGHVTDTLTLPTSPCVDYLGPVGASRADGVLMIDNQWLFQPDGTSLASYDGWIYSLLPDNRMVAATANGSLVLLSPTSDVVWSFDPVESTGCSWDLPSAQSVTVDVGSRLVLVHTMMTCHNYSTQFAMAFDLEQGNLTDARVIDEEHSGFVRFGLLVPTGLGTLLTAANLVGLDYGMLVELGCCSGHGRCTDNYTCACDDDYFAFDCSAYCNSDTTCSGHGTCDRITGDCVCTYPYAGEGCGAICSRELNCSGHGDCTLYVDTFTCSCDADYNGPACDTFCNPNTTCSGHGSCVVWGQGTCICQGSWYGDDCSVYCDMSTTCSGNGFCQQDGSCDCLDSVNPLPAFGWQTDANCKTSGPSYVFWLVVGGVGLLILLLVGACVFVCCRRRLASARGTGVNSQAAYTRIG